MTILEQIHSRTHELAHEPSHAPTHVSGQQATHRATDRAAHERRPTAARERPSRRAMNVGFGASTLGTILVARSDRGIAAVLIGDDRATLRADLRRRFPDAAPAEGDAATDELAATVAFLVDAPACAAELAALPLDLGGTAFQRTVWQALREIPAGSTASYAEIAGRIGRPSSARAVAQACAANPVAILVPCHRVVGRDGRLAGYRWGVERKRTLLARETAA
jgi:AraC family transcriptional regulator, regulatory protein of adaptative response / methylated-DNA-[protein]-cysteine methyltransferase